MSHRIATYVNQLPVETARPALARCCGAGLWVERMLAARPFASDAALFDAATRFWRALGRADRLEAFSQHPRIGDRAGSQWSMQEQAGAAGASPATRVALVDGNRAYEKRFGHVFLICATGLPADTMLAELRRRMQNDPAKELEIAAGEQEKITRLRLEKLVSP